jgi:predicted phage terminase large subunit-like protein
VKIVKAAWNDALLNELENFPEGEHDDQVDTLSGAFNHLAQVKKVFFAC